MDVLRLPPKEIPMRGLLILGGLAAALFAVGGPGRAADDEAYEGRCSSARGR
jgi:hypothetical protein